jgi:hypothetical protein
VDTAALGAAIVMLVAACLTARYFRGVRVTPEFHPAAKAKASSEIAT